MDLLEIANRYYDEMLTFMREISVIPGPSGHEEQRAEYILKYLKSIGAYNAYIDEALNVICTVGEANDDMTVFMAHTDTVFPFDVPLHYVDDGDKIHCPGITDDVACLAVLLAGLKYILDNKIQLNRTLLFVANSCEEGLGNLKGCRQIFKDFAGKIKRMYTFDSFYSQLCNKSVGSHRYKVTAITEGGHSYSNFGNRNAIHVLAGIISEIYKIQVPKIGESKTTYNVGLIEGGTSVNTIAQNASMLVEYRSDNVDCLNRMKEKFHSIFENAKANCEELKVELVGDRPCMNHMDMQELHRLTELTKSIQQKYTGLKVKIKSASTDANIPHSLGIPAICVGVCNGFGPHTREEWLEKASVKKGFAIGLELMLAEGELR